MGVAASWLPPELWVIQPYSMGALMRCPPDQSHPCPVRPQEFIAPASGTVKIMDASELAILTCLMPRPTGRPTIVINNPDVARLFNLQPATPAAVEVLEAPQSDWERQQESRRQFVEALAALDDGED